MRVATHRRPEETFPPDRLLEPLVANPKRSPQQTRLRLPQGSWQKTVGSGLWLVLLIPAMRAPLEANMALHMLVQIPLLVLAGILSGMAIPVHVKKRLFNTWNMHGITGLLLASVTMTMWMLPVALDAALDQPVVTTAKFLSLPLLLGLPCALSWPRAGFIVRGVFVVELIALLFRTGWLYLASPTRLCTNYLLDAQQTTGEGIITAGGVVLVLGIARLLWGPMPHCPAKPNTGSDSEKRADQGDQAATSATGNGVSRP